MAEYIEREAIIDRLEKLFKLQASTARAIIEAVPAADVAPGSDFRDCRNELCLRCGKYKTKHLGSCDGCRWEH